MLVVAGIPVFFLELAIGQRLKKGALGSWNEISPYLGGLGITCGVVCYFCALYYNTLLAWVISYVVDVSRTVPAHKFVSIGHQDMKFLSLFHSHSDLTLRGEAVSTSTI